VGNVVIQEREKEIVIESTQQMTASVEKERVREPRVVATMIHSPVSKHNNNNTDNHPGPPVSNIINNIQTPAHNKLPTPIKHHKRIEKERERERKREKEREIEDVPD